MLSMVTNGFSMVMRIFVRNADVNLSEKSIKTYRNSLKTNNNSYLFFRRNCYIQYL